MHDRFNLRKMTREPDGRPFKEDGSLQRARVRFPCQFPGAYQLQDKTPYPGWSAGTLDHARLAP